MQANTSSDEINWLVCIDYGPYVQEIRLNRNDWTPDTHLSFHQ